MPNKNIYYSDKYFDEKFEYRHVMLPKELAKLVPKTHLMSEAEWRNLGVQQSQGWFTTCLTSPSPTFFSLGAPPPPTTNSDTDDCHTLLLLLKYQIFSKIMKRTKMTNFFFRPVNNFKSLGAQ